MARNGFYARLTREVENPQRDGRKMRGSYPGPVNPWQGWIPAGTLFFVSSYEADGVEWIDIRFIATGEDEHSGEPVGWSSDISAARDLKTHKFRRPGSLVQAMLDIDNSEKLPETYGSIMANAKELSTSVNAYEVLRRMVDEDRLTLDQLKRLIDRESEAQQAEQEAHERAREAV